MGQLQSLLILIAALCSSCIFCGPRPPSYAPVELESGVIVQDLLRPEAGPRAERGDQIILHYEMKLADGSIVDSSFERGQPIELELGAGELPPGLVEGIVGMRLFGKRLLTVPASLGYGDEGLEGQVPPGEVLSFLLELMGLKPAS